MLMIGSFHSLLRIDKSTNQQINRSTNSQEPAAAPAIREDRLGSRAFLDESSAFPEIPVTRGGAIGVNTPYRQNALPR
jgi:hypothetical protein